MRLNAWNRPLVKVALLDLKSKMPLQKLPESVAILGWPPVATLSCRIGDLATRFPRRHVRPSPDHPAPYS